MKILIICSFYPPDSAISAVRPYMLAKYLVKLGHEVTVLRSGKVNMIPDNSFPPIEGVDVYSFLGDDSEAELFEKGHYSNNTSKMKLGWISGRTRRCLSSAYHALFEVCDVYKRLKKAHQNFLYQKRIINSKMNNYRFNIVFSTYSNVENIYAGQYAAKLYGAKWIQDFRDSITEYDRSCSLVWNIIGYHIQRFALKNADLCTTVSTDLAKQLNRCYPIKNVQTIYNGYDNYSQENPQNNIDVSNSKFSLCYTGQLYGERKKALKFITGFLKEMVEDGIICRDRIRFYYAGPDSEIVSEVFKDMNFYDVVCDLGYISRNLTYYLQRQTDIFLVLSWNTKRNKGVLTGKFYEGIRANKPILAIVTGDIPHSELYEFNEKYNYGFCFEQCRAREQTAKLKSFLSKMYKEKEVKGNLSFNLSEDIKRDFSYEHIAKELERCISEIL